MTSYQAVEKRCDECGKAMHKAHRIHAGQRFCSVCYKRVFEQRPCPKCTLIRRLPKTDLTAICRQCEIDMPCARCGKAEYRIGKITPFGPVCNSCSVYFRPPKAGALSAEDVSRSKTTAGQPLQTTSSDNRGTCRSCRRHRKISMSPDGRRLCAACLRDGLVPCPSCGDKMPAGRGNTCESCYWRDTFHKRLALDEAGLSSSRFVALFREFGMWLLTQVPAQKAALAIHRYFPFFYDMEKRWGKIPTYAQLLTHFDAEGLRRVRLPMRWLSETSQVLVDPQQREDASDWRRIEAITASIPSGTPASRILLAYKDALQARVTAGTATVRTVRLSLRPAVSLLAMCERSEFNMPVQAALDRYLVNVPGQKAAITGFVSFMNKHYGANLSIRLDEKRTLSLRRKRLEAELVSLVREENRDDDFRIKWLSVGLTYFHGLPRSVGMKLGRGTITTDESGNFSILWNEKTYWVPHWDYRAGESLDNIVIGANPKN